MGYLYLTIAILGEVVATSALKASDGLTQLRPTVVVVVGYGVALLFLSLTIRTIPVGIAYAVWAGIGTVLIVAAGGVLYDQWPDAAGLLGIGLIICGVVTINLFSASAGH